MRAIFVFLLSAVVAVGSPTMEDAALLFSEANEAALSQPVDAARLYHQAAQSYAHLVASAEEPNGYLEANLANSLYLSGDLGRAILHYRRAERLLPGNSDIAESLAHVREQAVDRFPEAEGQGIRGLIEIVPFWVRALVFAICWIALWVLAMVWFATRRRDLLPWIWGLFGASAVLGLTLWLRAAAGEAAVITADDVVARKGDGFVYEPAFTNPLHAGTELEITEERGDWIYASLPGGHRAWLPIGSVERVVPVP